MQRLAADLAKYLDELEYYEIKEKVFSISYFRSASNLLRRPQSTWIGRD